MDRINSQSCPQCKVAISPGTWFCAQCGHALPAGQPSPSAHRRFALIFWGFGLLFIAAITLGLVMLVPHVVK
jgi:predicted nucleic acid-binding Zn ribbon protein